MREINLRNSASFYVTSPAKLDMSALTEEMNSYGRLIKRHEGDYCINTPTSRARLHPSSSSNTYSVDFESKDRKFTNFMNQKWPFRASMFVEAFKNTEKRLTNLTC
jgi:hypothetical protein